MDTPTFFQVYYILHHSYEENLMKVLWYDRGDDDDLAVQPDE